MYAKKGKIVAVFVLFVALMTNSFGSYAQVASTNQPDTEKAVVVEEKVKEAEAQTEKEALTETTTEAGAQTEKEAQPEAEKEPQPVVEKGTQTEPQTEKEEESKSQINKDSINEGIANLDYNKYEVLASRGDVIQNVIPKEGRMKNGKFIVLEHNKKQLTTSPVDISVVDAIINRTYPGSLLLADKEFIDNRPTMLRAQREPITISIDLPGSGKSSMKVKDPSYGTINSAINKLIDEWSAKHSSTHNLPARTQYNESMVHSKNQIKAALNIDINVLEQTLGINFDAISKNEKSVMVAAYKQIFYNVNAEIPNNPADLFHESVNFAELQRKGVSDSTPPVMVSNVAYGRTIYVVLETDSSSDKVESAFKALIKGQTIEAGSEFEHIVDNSSFSVVVLGGDAQEHNRLITTNYSDIREVIKNNATFSLKNPGYPISYSSTFLKDNALAAVHNSTDYVETTSTEYTGGKIILDHSGAYVAQFDVQWDEVSYDDKGNEVLTHHQWAGSNQDKTAHYNTVISLPANATNIKVLARECTGLAWEWWRTVVDERNVPLMDEAKVSIWGTTLHPRTYTNF